MGKNKDFIWNNGKHIKQIIFSCIILMIVGLFFSIASIIVGTDTSIVVGILTMNLGFILLFIALHQYEFHYVGKVKKRWTQ
jgi:hypothetical protein